MRQEARQRGRMVLQAARRHKPWLTSRRHAAATETPRRALYESAGKISTAIPASSLLFHYIS